MKKRNKNQQYKKILKIIESCKTIKHIQNCEVILQNFFRMHKCAETYSILRMELKFKLMHL